MIDWPSEMRRFEPMMGDPKVIRRTRQLSAATVRATRYVGTPRHRRYTFGIARHIAALTSETAVRYGLMDDFATVRSLIEHLALGGDVRLYRLEGLRPGNPQA